MKVNKRITPQSLTANRSKKQADGTPYTQPGLAARRDIPYE